MGPRQFIRLIGERQQRGRAPNERPRYRTAQSETQFEKKKISH